MSKSPFAHDLQPSALLAGRADIACLVAAVDLVAEFVTLNALGCPAPGPSVLAASATCFSAEEPEQLALFALANARWGTA